MAQYPGMPTTSGIDLKVERVRAHVTVTTLAARMGLSRQSVHAIERSATVPQDRADQYRARLADLSDDASEPSTGGAAA